MSRHVAASQVCCTRPRLQLSSALVRISAVSTLRFRILLKMPYMNARIWMKKTLHIDEALLREARSVSGARSDTDAVRLGLEATKTTYSELVTLIAVHGGKAGGDGGYTNSATRRRSRGGASVRSPHLSSSLPHRFNLGSSLSPPSSSDSCRRSWASTSSSRRSASGVACSKCVSPCRSPHLAAGVFVIMYVTWPTTTPPE